MIPISQPGPLLVRSPNWLGDAIMALPAVRNLKTLTAAEPLTVAAPEKLAALWQACPFVDHVIPLTQPKSLWTSARKIRAAKCRWAVLLPNSLRAAAEALLAGIPQRIGYARDGRRLFLTDAIPAPPRNPLRLHQRFYYLDLAAAAGASSDDSFPALKAGPAAKLEPIFAVCPGAEYGPAKRWPVERFAETARHFLAAHHLKPVIFGAAADTEVAAELAAKLPGAENRTGQTTLAELAAKLPGAENRTGQTTLAEFMAALAGARLVLCNDSGAMHLASALGAPTVAIFGSTEPQMTGPLGPRTQVLRHHVPCSPCFLRECPIDFACMNSITPAMAIAAGEELLSNMKT